MLESQESRDNSTWGESQDRQRSTNFERTARKLLNLALAGLRGRVLFRCLALGPYLPGLTASLAQYFNDWAAVIVAVPTATLALIVVFLITALALIVVFLIRAVVVSELFRAPAHGDREHSDTEHHTTYKPAARRLLAKRGRLLAERGGSVLENRVRLPQWGKRPSQQ